MKQSYLEAMISLIARIKLAKSQCEVKKNNDNKLTRQGNSKGIKSFSKINSHDTPVGINFANISARNYTALKKSAQEK